MRPRTFLRSVLPVLLIAFPAGAQNSTDFHEYASPITQRYQASIGHPLNSGGFDFYNAPEFTNVVSQKGDNLLWTWGYDPAQDPAAINRPTNIGTATAIYSQILGSRIDILAGGQDPFAEVYQSFGIASIDVAHLYSELYAQGAFAFSDISLRIFGFAPNGASFFQDFLIPLAPGAPGTRSPLLRTLSLNSRFSDVTEVTFFQGTGSGRAFQFTNVVATPEPSSMILLGSGLSALAGLATRRRRRSQLAA